MAFALPPKNAISVEVTKDSGADFLAKFNTSHATKQLIIPNGTYVLPSPLQIADNEAADIVLIGQSRNGVIIKDAVGCDTAALLQSLDSDWTSNSRVTLRNMTFYGDNNIYKAINLPFTTVDIQNVLIRGSYKAAGANNRIPLYVGGAGALASPSIIDNVSIMPDNEVYRLAEFWLEGLGGGTISLLNSNGDATTGVRCLGTHASFKKIMGFLGNGKSLTRLINTLSCDVEIGSIFINKTGTPTLLPNLFLIDASSALTVQSIQDQAGCVLFEDATSQAQTRITGSYNAKGAWTHGVATGTGAQQTIAHGLATTPSRVMLSEATTGLAIPYQSAVADATNIYVLATLNKTFNWRAEI